LTERSLDRVGGRLLKSGVRTKEDIIRGIGQRTNALTIGYQSAALVTSVQRARRLRPEVFNERFVLLGVGFKGKVQQVHP
jgi:hypothetical protein